MVASMSLVFLLEVLFLFSVVTENFGADICFIQNYNTYNLTQRHWRVHINESNHCPFAASQGCNVTFIFCSPLNAPGNCSNASVCQQSKEGFFRMATYTLNRPYVALSNNTEGFQSVFGPGSVFNNSGVMCNLKTTLTFVCDEKLTWPLRGQQSGVKVQEVPTSPTITFSKSTCQYNMTFKYSGACANFIPVSNTRELSAGTVLVIIFFVFMFVYFVFGSMWNMGCKGARGLEAVPHYDFWTDLPVLVSDGFLFAIRCGRVDSLGTTYESI